MHIDTDEISLTIFFFFEVAAMTFFNLSVNKLLNQRFRCVLQNTWSWNLSKIFDRYLWKSLFCGKVAGTRFFMNFINFISWNISEWLWMEWSLSKTWKKWWLKKTWNLAPVLQNVHKILENYCPCSHISVDQNWWLKELYFKRYLQKCTLSHVIKLIMTS